MKKAKTTFLYRVAQTDAKKKQRKHLAEVQASSDEDARRKIVHTAVAEGGTVQTIHITTDRTRYPGESAKRVYRG